MGDFLYRHKKKIIAAVAIGTAAYGITTFLDFLDRSVTAQKPALTHGYDEWAGDFRAERDLAVLEEQKRALSHEIDDLIEEIATVRRYTAQLPFDVPQSIDDVAAGKRYDGSRQFSMPPPQVFSIPDKYEPNVA